MAPAPKRRKILQSLYLDQAAIVALDRLAKASGTPKAVLLREGVDDLLVKHKAMKPRRGK